MKLYFVRHGETDWNKKRLFQGHTDVELNSTGVEQARRVAAYLESINIAAVYASDLKRAYRTGEIIARPHGLIPIKDVRLRELNFGLWEGLDYNTIFKKYKNEFEAWYKDALNTRIPRGGSVREVLDNLVYFLKDISSKDYDEIVVATHGGVIKTLLWYIKKKNIVLWEQKILPGSITIVEYNHGENLSLQEVNILP